LVLELLPLELLVELLDPLDVVLLLDVPRVESLEVELPLEAEWVVVEEAWRAQRAEHRLDAPGELDGRVQADHRARHAVVPRTSTWDLDPENSSVERVVERAMLANVRGCSSAGSP